MLHLFNVVLRVQLSISRNCGVFISRNLEERYKTAMKGMKHRAEEELAECRDQISRSKLTWQVHHYVDDKFPEITFKLEVSRHWSSGS